MHKQVVCGTYLDYTRSGKNPFMILELQGTSRLKMATGNMTQQREHRCSTTRKLLSMKSNVNWQGSKRNGMEAVNQVFGANEVEILQKSL
jgi:hypothetical protein